MTKNLRFGGDYKVVEDAARGSLLFSDEAFIREVERCHGCGKCRTQVKTTTMCPVFKVTLDEAMSPRGRGNLLRSIIKGRLGLDTLRSEEIRDLLFTCLNCKSCLVECPSEVNVPKLMLETKARYVSEKGQERKNNFLVNIDSYARMGSLLASLSNSVLKNRTFRALAERIVGVDRRRSIPEFHGETFTKWFERHKTAGYSRRSESSRRVAYFVDTYANYNDPDLGRAVVEVLERNDFEVVVPDQIGSGLPAITYGSLDRARKIAERNVKSLAEVVKDGVKIVCSSPSAALALRDEYLDLLDSDEARIVAENTYEIGEFLLELYERGELDTGFEEIEGVYAYHAPCHLKALGKGLPLVELLRKVLGLDVRVLETGCCGLAGSFGFKKDYYDQSMEIGEELFEEVRKSGAETVLTDCETCKLQIEHGSGVNVIFPIKLLRQAYQE